MISSIKVNTGLLTMNSLAVVSAIVWVLAYGYIKITKKLDEIEDRAIKRHALLEDWLFQSLYSLNNKVLLPTEADRPLDTKPAKIYSPTDDVMSEFTGDRMDW